MESDQPLPGWHPAEEAGWQLEDSKAIAAACMEAAGGSAESSPQWGEPSGGLFLLCRKADGAAAGGREIDAVARAGGYYRVQACLHCQPAPAIVHPA